MVRRSLIALAGAAAIAGLSDALPLPLRRREDACACRNWKDVYESGAAACGEGNELFYVDHEASETLVQKHKKFDASAWISGRYGTYDDVLCKQAFQRLDTNKCVQLNIGHDEGKWCYVDSACRNLKAGANLNEHVSWKLCAQKTDELFSEVQPEQLAGMAREFDVDLGILHKLAYPLERAKEGPYWTKVSQVWQVDTGDRDIIPLWRQKAMMTIIASGRPHGFDTNEMESSPYAIVVGKKVYMVQEDPARDTDHPGTWQNITCISGCDA